MTNSETPDNNDKHIESVTDSSHTNAEANVDTNTPVTLAPPEIKKTTDESSRDNQKTSKKADKETETPRKKTIRNTILIVLCVLILLLLGIVTTAIYYGHALSRNWLAEQDAKLQQLRTEIVNTKTIIDKNSASLNGLGNALNQQVGNYEQRLKVAEDRLQAQNKRLLSLSTTTREDWLLAEAEYLLKLANQRVLIEKNIDGADALLSEADIILRDLDDPDLFPLRQAIHDDLAELRLTEKIDQQGIYLSLVALATQIESLPILPMTRILSVNSTEQEESYSAAEPPSSLWQQFKNSFSHLTSTLKNYIRITDHSEKPQLILTPESALYLQQNLRLMIERAQLALMREQQVIYQSSLEQAQIWLQQYFPDTEKRRLFLQQLEIEKNKDITRTLPDITDSLELIHSYIQQLHQLNGVGKPKLTKPLSSNVSTKTPISAGAKE